MIKYQATLKDHLKRYIRRIFGLTILRTLPHGFDICFDLNRTNIPIDVVFDVGAHIGQSALKFKNSFPNCSIYCFEPTKTNYESLVQNTEKLGAVNCYALALGERMGICNIYITNDSMMNSVIRPERFLKQEQINMSTVDAFARDHGVKNIDVLKIDAEGYDLEVLRGSNEMLSKHKILFIIVEITFNTNNNLVNFEDIRTFLSNFDYAVFGIYDQSFIWPERRRLEYANAAFCHKSVLNRRALT